MCRNLAFTATFLAALGAGSLAMAAETAPAAAPATPAEAAAAPDAPAAPVRASPEQRREADRADPLTRATFWNQQFDIDPGDTEAGLKLSAALRAIGQADTAADTAQKIVLQQPDNIDALLEVGRDRIAQGQAFYGIASLEKAEQAAPSDWRAPSLLGVAYEQVGRSDDAWAAYQRALTLSPGNPSVLSNLAMYHVARGETGEAETLLRQAVSDERAGIQVRQNLAFVLGLEGKLTEAENLMRKDLPPEIADNNLAYLKAMQNDPSGAAASLRSGG